MKIKIEDTLTKPLKSFSKGLPNIYNYILGEVSKEYADHLKNNYLSGQKLNRISGMTYNSVKFFKEKELKFGISTGVGIKGSLNYLNKFIGTKHEFFKPAVKSFKSKNNAQKISERIINDILKSKGLK